MGTANPSRELILRQKASILVHHEEHLQEITSTLLELSQAAMEQDVQILTSIRGIGDKTAANFLIEMGGQIQKFETHNKLIAMAGLDPSVYQSGKVRRAQQDHQAWQQASQKGHLADDDPGDPVQ